VQKYLVIWRPVDSWGDQGESSIHTPIPSLTGLRFFAAASVVLAHAFAMLMKHPVAPPWHTLVTGLASPGMTLFFVLSGFVIQLTYAESIWRPRGLTNFAIARFARLYPIYIAAVAYDLLVKYSFHQLPPEKLGALPYYLTLTQSWFYKPIGDLPLIYQYGLLPQVSWSISTEFFFYLAFPIICLAIRRLSAVGGVAIATVVIAVTGLALNLVLNHLGPDIHALGVRLYGAAATSPQDSLFRWVRYFSPYVRIFEFILGCLCAALFLQWRHREPSAAEQRGAFVAMLAVLAGAAAFHYAAYGPHPPGAWRQYVGTLHFSYAIFSAAIIFGCARYRNPIVNFVSRPWIVLGGEISLSMYMLHFLIIGAFRYETPVISSARVSISSYLMLGVVLLTVFGLSLVVWKVFELPCRRLLRKAMRVEGQPSAPDIRAPDYAPGQALNDDAASLPRSASTGASPRGS